MVHCAAITEQSEPGVARAKGIALKINQTRNASPKLYFNKIKKCDRDTKGLVLCIAKTER